MKTSHDGLGITDAEWKRFVEHVAATLKNLSIAERETAEFLAATEGLRSDVVHTPHAVGV
jgi:hemoglobin